MGVLKGGEESVRGISVKTFPGHTAHMQAVIVRGTIAKGSDGKGTTSVMPSGATDAGALAPVGTTACYISDLIPTSAHIDLAWGMGFDLYPLQPIASKMQFYRQS